MDTIKKVLHPNESHTDDNADQQPNATGTDHPAPATEIHHESTTNKQPRAGHHHPRQPVGATGLPPNHKPRSDFVSGGGSSGGSGEGGEDLQQSSLPTGVTGAEAGLEGGDVDKIGKIVAETGNNFPGTNPHLAHSALGNKDTEGTQGILNPGRE